MVSGPQIILLFWLFPEHDGLPSTVIVSFVSKELFLTGRPGPPKSWQRRKAFPHKIYGSAHGREGRRRNVPGPPLNFSWLVLPFSPLLTGRLRAINPDNGFFGVAPGTSATTNPNAMATIQSNTLFTNVAETSDGGVYWEGIDQPLPPGVTVTSWLGKAWKPGM